MSLRDVGFRALLDRLARELTRSGIAPDTPVASISRVSTPDEYIHLSTLADLHTGCCGPAPLLLLIGRSLADAHL